MGLGTNAVHFDTAPIGTMVRGTPLATATSRSQSCQRWVGDLAKLSPRTIS